MVACVVRPACSVWSVEPVLPGWIPDLVAQGLLAAFADGQWVKPDGEPLLRAADFFMGGEDGRFDSLTVAWAKPD